MSDLTHSNQPAISDRHEHHQDALSRVTWASIFVLAGLVFFADNLGYLPQIEGASAWKWIVLGAGGLLLLENLARVFSVDHRGPHLWTVILGCALLGWGAGEIFGVNLWEKWWPFGLIVIGLLIIARGLRRNSST